MKKLLSLLLSLTLTVSMIGTAFAADTTSNPYNTTILEDSDTATVVQTSDSQFTYITTKDKVNGTMQVTTIDNQNNATINGEAVVSMETISRPVPKASTYENTFTNYEYTKTYGNPNEWQLRRPDGTLTGTYYFNTYEVTKNKEYITKFQNAVDTINVKEGEIVMALGLVALSDFIAAAVSAGAIATGGVLTGAAWTSILVAAGHNANYLSVCQQWDSACKSAWDAYNDTKTKSPTIFF